MNISPAPQPSPLSNWPDEEDVRHRVIRQGASFQVKGNSSDGQMYDSGVMENNTVRPAHMLNGVRYGAALKIITDASQLMGGYGSAAIGEVGTLAPRRIP